MTEEPDWERDEIAYLMETQGMSFVEAVQALAEMRFGLEWLNEQQAKKWPN